ncbi:MAG: serine/threonine protein kinase [Tabrizicola sp.]|jgi:hypothetical protein|nr:serine/threonine protein kinase [Tabrizicola sp.]
MTSAAVKLEEVGIGSQTDELQPGTRLLQGQFTVESFLNAGGFGITYLALDSLDRRVVVKECFPASFCRRTGVAVGPRTRQREDEFRSVVKLFLQEAYTVSKLDHPNIVKVHQVFEDNETAYMAMEYVQGPDLLETVEGTAPALPPGQIVDILHQMLDALGYVHAQGVLHRDISPDNILLDRVTGRPVLIDFGASRKDVTRKSRALSGLRVVKDGYSPQEFYISGSAQAPCSDLYALAATFAHLITRETPKTSQERLSSIANRQGDPHQPLTGRVQGYPTGFLKAIDKAMSIFPRDRIQSVADWQAMLREDPPVARQAVPQAAQAAVSVPIARPVQTEAPALPHAVPVASFEAGRALGPALQPAVAQSVSAPGQIVVRRGSRDLLMSSAAAILLLVGLLSLPNDTLSRLWPGEPPQASVAANAPGSQATALPIDLPIVQRLELENGLVFQLVSDGPDVQTVVAALPEGAETDLQVGDVLLVYAATGEQLKSATALADILKRDMTNNVATYSFAVQRQGKMAVGSFRLSGLG